MPPRSAAADQGVAAPARPAPRRLRPLPVPASGAACAAIYLLNSGSTARGGWSGCATCSSLRTARASSCRACWTRPRPARTCATSTSCCTRSSAFALLRMSSALSRHRRGATRCSLSSRSASSRAAPSTRSAAPLIGNVLTTARYSWGACARQWCMPRRLRPWCRQATSPMPVRSWRSRSATACRQLSLLSLRTGIHCVDEGLAGV